MADPLKGISGVNSSDDNYDPHHHRQVRRPTNNFETFVHLIKASIGTGILAMPQAFSKAGMVTGVVATTLTGILITYCLHTIVRTTYILCKRQGIPFMTYPDAVKAAFTSGPGMLRPVANVATGAVDFFLVTYQLGICCVYVVFLGETMKALLDNYLKLSATVWMLIILPPLIAINLIGNLKQLAPLSVVANLMIFTGLCIVVYFVTTEKAETEPLDLWGTPSTLPLFLGTVLFALTAVGVVIAIENNMMHPKSFGGIFGVLNLAMTVIVFLYVLIGVLGYNYCVSKCQDSITLNMPQNTLGISVKALFAAAIFISYALHCYVPVEITWYHLKPRLEKNQYSEKAITCWEYGVRAGLCLLTFIFAASIPRLGLFISLFGALCLSVLGVCYPALMDICIRHPNYSGSDQVKLIRDLLIFGFGVFALFVGSISAVVAIVNSFL